MLILGQKSFIKLYLAINPVFSMIKLRLEKVHLLSKVHERHFRFIVGTDEYGRECREKCNG